MRKSILMCVMALAAVSALAADATPKDEVIAAAKKLGESPNYTWKQTTETRDDSQFRPGPQEGRIEKDGALHLKTKFGDFDSEMVRKGDKGAATTQDGWQSFAEMENGEGFTRYFAARWRTLKAPAELAQELVGYAKDLKKEGDAYTSELTDEGAKIAIVGFRRGDGGFQAKSAKGSVKFWIKDGVLSKYEYKLKGVTQFGDNENEQDRTTTVEIKDVGTTKVTIPEEAKKKLS